jgi:hypothetical protein
MWNGKQVDLYVSHVYWMVLDKFAHKAVGMTAEHRRKDPMGGILDDGIEGGTKIGLSEMHLMCPAKGWDHVDVLPDLLYGQNNMPEAAAKEVRDILVALRT